MFETCLECPWNLQAQLDWSDRLSKSWHSLVKISSLLLEKKDADILSECSALWPVIYCVWFLEEDVFPH